MREFYRDRGAAYIAATSPNRIHPLSQIRPPVVKIQGGLGNQMFQYAFARALQERLQTEIHLDLQFCQWHRRRPLQLDRFDCTLAVATPSQLQAYCSRPAPAWKLGLIDTMARHAAQPGPGRTLFRKILKQNRVQPDRDVVREADGDAIPDDARLRAGVYLDGYWQDPRRFGEFDSLIRKDLQLRAPLSEPARGLLARIEGEACPVSVHIRRGDYLSSKVATMFRTLTPSHYRAAIERIREAHADARFVFFSDDMNWVKQELGDVAADPIHADLGLPAHEDLWLMSRCAHHVIANSTFSWWGAWLNPSPDKLVIAPDTWAEDKATRALTSNVIPDNWIRLATPQGETE